MAFEKDLSKQEILKRLNDSGLIHRFNSEKLWKMAFEMYNRANGDTREVGCAKCYNIVIEWLQRP